jgi:hypothetical protein
MTSEEPRRHRLKNRGGARGQTREGRLNDVERTVATARAPDANEFNRPGSHS